MWSTAIRIKDALVHGLRDRRMREDRPHQLCLGGLQRLSDGVALDQLGDLGADHVRAEELASLAVEHGLDHALGLAERDCLAVADERKTPDFNLVALIAGRLLGEADAGDLRAA